MRYKIGQWVAFSSVSRDREILGKVVAPKDSDAIVSVETRDRCETGTRTVTFYDDAPWFPSPVRWKRLPNGRKGWEYAR